MNELLILIEAKERIKKYKGNQWKAEFIRLLYPENKAQSAKGFNDLISRLTKGPWGLNENKRDKNINDILNQLLQ